MLKIALSSLQPFLADRTNGRAIGTLLRPSVCRRLWRYYYLEPIGSRTWEIDWYQNERPWLSFRGRIKVMSTIASHSTSNISETVRDIGLVPKDHQQEMAYGLSNGHVTDDVTWPWKVKLVTPIRLERNWKWLDLEASFQKKWHMNYQTVTWPIKPRDPKVLWGSTVGYPSDSLASCWLIHRCDGQIDGRTGGTGDRARHAVTR